MLITTSLRVRPSSAVHNHGLQLTLDFPHFSGHASITPTKEKTDARNDYGEEDVTLQHRV